MAERIVLSDRLDTAAAQALATQLLSHPPGRDIVLDGSNIAHLGAQAVQVIVSAGKAARTAGGTLTCADFSERGQAQLAQLGLSTEALTEGAR